jgi:hypothetical protein
MHNTAASENQILQGNPYSGARLLTTTAVTVKEHEFGASRSQLEG